jgi:tRNA-specific adenosine deaminase 3
MDLEETIKAIEPLKGEVVPIRTIQETQPPEDFSMLIEPGLSLHFQRL